MFPVVLSSVLILTAISLVSAQNASAYWENLQAALSVSIEKLPSALALYSMLSSSDTITFVGELTNGWVTSSGSTKDGQAGTTMFIPKFVITATVQYLSNQTLGIINNNSSLILAYMLYNLISDVIPTIAISPGHTIINTTLNDPNFVMLGNGSSQVLVLTQDSNGTCHVLNQLTDVILNTQGVLDLTPVSFTWAVSSELLVMPSNLSATASSAGFEAFASSASDAGVLSMFEGEHGITIFVPQDVAIDSGSLSSLNAAELGLLWRGHAVSGTNYSPGLANKQFTSLAGIQLSVSLDGMTVSIEGGNSAKILTSDILLSNGVVHILDSVLMSSLLANLAPDSATGGATGSGCIGNGLELLSAQRSESFRKWGEGSIASMEVSVNDMVLLGYLSIRIVIEYLSATTYTHTVTLLQ
ncbi:hypothetical protein HYDPIDRAFT_28241 [Hydnomerulius pinastri MD-312]|uniref:FAS1 domain-containing protein n=1 Tax=Hydnomerulius pinastri MD-312 TaxID=994086 RepID=A0A0C9WAC6_9AGAM|nr:hypothetical protein HYDPIDRAFT_28241 [Hydnomerulius pinastri MD-312]